MIYLSSSIKKEEGVSIEIDGRGSRANHFKEKRKSMTTFSGGIKWK
jgi:hypothetical protein